MHNAIAIVLIHNHPSGNIQPSMSDILLTKSIIMASQTLNLNVVDHLIFTDESYYSFADEGVIDSLRQMSPVVNQQEA